MTSHAQFRFVYGSQSPVPYRLAKPQYLLTRKVCKIAFEKLKDGTRGPPSRRVRRRASPYEGEDKMKDNFSFRQGKYVRLKYFFRPFRQANLKSSF